MKYTVLLLRPDYMTSDFGQDTYLAHVEADSVAEAQALAQHEAYRSDVPPDDDDHDGSACLGYYVLLVVGGHATDLTERE